MTKFVRGLIAALIMALLSVGAYWYYSPYLVMRSIAAAAKAKDADKFNESVDYPRLRESLKGQFSAQMAKVVGEQSGSPFGALGAMVGMAMVNQLLDAFVRPEMVMQMMKDGQVQSDKTVTSPSESRNDGEPEWVIERKGPDRLIAIPKKGVVPVAADELGFVFERSGFATWKLTELRITFPSK